MIESQETLSPEPPGVRIIALSFMVAGIIIGALSFPVSQASHAVAAEVKKANPGKEGVWRIGGDAAEVGAKGWRFAGRGGQEDHPLMQIFKAIVAILSLAWCCCVMAMTVITAYAIEPLGQALGSAAQFSVYTMTVFFVLFAIVHFATGVGVLRGCAWVSWVARLLLLTDGSQGLIFLGASLALWNEQAPLFSIVSLGLGTGLTLWAVLTWWALFRRNQARR